MHFKRDQFLWHQPLIAFLVNAVLPGESKSELGFRTQQRKLPPHSKLARNQRKAAVLDRKEGLENIEEKYAVQRAQRTEIANQAEHYQQQQQQMPGIGRMMMHYFLAGVGVTVGFIIIGVAMRAVGLEGDESTAPCTSASSVLRPQMPLSGRSADDDDRA